MNIKTILPISFALLLFIVMALFFKAELTHLFTYVWKEVGPTSLALFGLGLYALSGLIIAYQLPKAEAYAIKRVLVHSRTMSSAAVGVGIIGTYLGAKNSLASGGVDQSHFAQALSSTLIALIISVIVAVASEILAQHRDVELNGAEA